MISIIYLKICRFISRENVSLSKFGLKIRSSTYGANLVKSNLMDICVEPVNDNVTCALYVTTQTIVTMHNRFSTLSRVCIEPVAEFSSVYVSYKVDSNQNK